MTTPSFVAIDFETADYQADSACSVALVRVEGGEIVGSHHTLIRPPRREFVFTYLHGIDWPMVEHAPVFAEAWPEIERFVAGAEFLAAHNAPFDRGVLQACLRSAGLPLPRLRFRCTVQMARNELGIRPANLANVCRRLGIPLENHHEALCDAEACARIVLAAQARRGG